MCNLQVHYLGTQEYSSVFTSMQEFTNKRTQEAVDEFWCVQHPPVFTLGANADIQHIHTASEISIIKSDRGGEVTYHGPGQAIIYLLVDLHRKSIGVKKLVQCIEQSVIELLYIYGISSESCTDAHGVYIEGVKIASLGLRVRSGCSYHGVALNVDMDLNPFSLINPCGFSGLKVTQLKDHGVKTNCQQIQKELVELLCIKLNYKIDKVTDHGQ